MTTSRPLQRVLKHHPNVKRTADRFAEQAELVDVARAIIKRELDEIGVDREHDEDRAERTVTAALAGHPGDTEPASIDYADPTGSGQAGHVARRWQQLTDDLEALQDLETEHRDTIAHMLAIAHRHAHPANASEPMCEYCESAAEPTTTERRKFRGAMRIAGEWVRRAAGRAVLCAVCRKRIERGAA